MNLILKNQNLILTWLQNNKSLIVSDILKGRGQFCLLLFYIIKYIVRQPKNIHISPKDA